MLLQHKTTCVLDLLGADPLTQNKLNTGGDGFVCRTEQVGKWYNSQLILVQCIPTTPLLRL